MMTRQEMFDKAVRGLRGQGWQKAGGRYSESCQYLTENGLRCAWGHVDPAGTKSNPACGVGVLANRGIGIAASLSSEDAFWAQRLQVAHDQSEDGKLEESMRVFGKNSMLVWPED